jgi:hypothetical protein
MILIRLTLMIMLLISLVMKCILYYLLFFQMSMGEPDIKMMKIQASGKHGTQRPNY